RPDGPRRDTIVPDPKMHRLKKGHTAEVKGVRFLPGGKRAVSVGMDGRVLLWDLEKGGAPSNLEPEKGKRFLGMAVSRDGKMLAAGVAGKGGAVHLYDLAGKGKFLRSIKGGRIIDQLAFNPDGSILAVAGRGM